MAVYLAPCVSGSPTGSLCRSFVHHVQRRGICLGVIYFQGVNVRFLIITWFSKTTCLFALYHYLYSYANAIYRSWYSVYVLWSNPYWSRRVALWGAHQTGHFWQYLLASPVVIMRKVVGQHLFLNIIPSNFTTRKWTESLVWLGR